MGWQGSKRYSFGFHSDPIWFFVINGHICDSKIYYYNLCNNVWDRIGPTFSFLGARGPLEGQKWIKCFFFAKIEQNCTLKKNYLSKPIQYLFVTTKLSTRIWNFWVLFWWWWSLPYLLQHSICVALIIVPPRYLWNCFICLTILFV